MKTSLNPLSSERGFTLLELMVTVSIMVVLYTAISATYGTLQARIRYSQVRANMDAIAMAGYTDFTTNNIWAPWSSDLPPSFVANNTLRKWPSPPCANWTYAWENWTDFLGTDMANVVRVTIRNAAGDPIWAYCLDTIGGSGNCMTPDPINHVTPNDIITSSQRYVYCNE